MATPLTFPADVFARLAPELYLQRHLEQGLRPAGPRALEDFRPVVINTTLQSSETSSFSPIGFAAVRSGGTSLICSVTAGVTESIDGGGVFANVELARNDVQGTANGSITGGNRLPSQEEMVLSQQVQQILRSATIGVTDLSTCKDGTQLVINVTCMVLSRSGPLFDPVWNGIMTALSTTKVPKTKLHPDNDTELLWDAEVEPVPLKFKPSLASSFGLAVNPKDSSTVVLADLEGETEEATIKDTVSVCVSQESPEMLTSVSIASPTVPITRETLSKIFTMARNRRL